RQARAGRCEEKGRARPREGTEYVTPVLWWHRKQADTARGGVMHVPKQYPVRVGCTVEAEFQAPAAPAPDELPLSDPDLHVMWRQQESGGGVAELVDEHREWVKEQERSRPQDTPCNIKEQTHWMTIPRRSTYDTIL